MRSLQEHAQTTAVIPAKASHREEWLRMRSALWSECLPEEHLKEMGGYLSYSSFSPLRAFVALRPTGGLCGFLEASIRPYAEDCDTHPVGYLEGWYVDPDMRKQGIARLLVSAAENWAAEQGCQEMASDTRIDNTLSQHVHQILGYEETSRVVHLRKQL